MTTEPRFLALVAKVDFVVHETEAFVDLTDTEWTSQEQLDDANRHLSIARALKGEIMRHEPIQNVGATWCNSCYDPDKDSWVLFPCKPWLDMEAEVGK